MCLLQVQLTCFLTICSFAHAYMLLMNLPFSYQTLMPATQSSLHDIDSRPAFSERPAYSTRLGETRLVPIVSPIRDTSNAIRSTSCQIRPRDYCSKWKFPSLHVLLFMLGTVYPLVLKGQDCCWKHVATWAADRRSYSRAQSLLLGKKLRGPMIVSFYLR